MTRSPTTEFIQWALCLLTTWIFSRWSRQSQTLLSWCYKHSGRSHSGACYSKPPGGHLNRRNVFGIYWTTPATRESGPMQCIQILNFSLTIQTAPRAASSRRGLDIQKDSRYIWCSLRWQPGPFGVHSWQTNNVDYQDAKWSYPSSYGLDCVQGEMAILFCWQFVVLFVLPALATFCHFVWGRTFW